MLAVVALRAGATALVSADRSFATVHRLAFLDLEGLDVENVVAG